MVLLESDRFYILYVGGFCLVSIYKITALDVYTNLSESVKKGLYNIGGKATV